MANGKDVLIVYDDLSKHAVAYRTISLLLKRPPGREAYPGDIFYLHSRLLERSGRMNKFNGGGSITSLPIIETQAGDISAYIPTNVISITDGQLFMDTDMFNAGNRPAISAGLSVSRVGSAAQVKAIKQTSSSLKLELAQYSELNTFSQFGSDLDAETKKVLDHGQRVNEMIKQQENKPYSQYEEIILLFSIKEKFIKYIAVDDIFNFKIALLNHFNKLKIKNEIIKAKELTDKTYDELKKEMQKFINQYVKLKS